MIRTGRVITIENNRPMVCFDRLDACEKCGACYNNKKQTLVRVLGQAEIGNIVDVALPDNRILTLSVIMYVIPLLGLILGLLIGNAVLGTEVKTLLAGLAGMAVFFIAVKAIDKWLQNQPKWQPHIISVRGQGAQE